MWVPLWKHYEVSVSDSISKHVVCESCSNEYDYVLTRKAYGESKAFILLSGEVALRVADHKARKRLAEFLEEGCEPIPCPNCGQVQSHMFARARQLRHRWMWKAFIVLLPISVLLLIPALVMLERYEKDRTDESFIWALGLWSGLGITICIAIALGLWKYSSAKYYDPNSEPLETRLEFARNNTLSLDR